MAAAPPPWPHAAAATETRFCFRGRQVNVTSKPSHKTSSVRLHGGLVLSHGSRRFGPKGWFVDFADGVDAKLDVSAEVFCLAVFQCIEDCTELIHTMLATTGYDLAPENWAGSICKPDDIAMAVVHLVGREIDEILAGPVVRRPVVPDYDVDIEMPKLCVSLVYTDPKELLRACKEPAADTVAARVSARRRKRHREFAGERCAICLLDFLGTEEEEAVRLPCSHPFHSRCILPWFHLKSTCPTCRRDIMELTHS